MSTWDTFGDTARLYDRARESQQQSWMRRQERAYMDGRRRRRNLRLTVGALVALLIIGIAVITEPATSQPKRGQAIACWSGTDRPAWSWVDCARRQRGNHVRAAREIRDLRAELRRVRRAKYPTVEQWLWDAFLCIHRYEGAWNDPNPPYWGGLQMDMDFMRTYGPELLKAKGTADNWTPAEQMAVAIKAYRSGRGFHPWPNTARKCGLL
jgi:hypothetical protein